MLDELLAGYGAGRVPYSKLLLTAEWKAKRSMIIKRDEGRCTRCGKSATVWMDGQGWTLGHYWIESEWYMDNGMEVEPADRPYHLEVHHKFYVHNRYPWDYPATAFQTLCNWCHQLVHQQLIVPYYDDEGQALGYTPCLRCNGAGSFSEYTHVQSGVCFRCGGARYEELLEAR